MAGGGESTGEGDRATDEIESLARRAVSPERRDWRPARAKLGRLAAAGDAATRERIWRLAGVNTLGMRFVQVAPGQFEMGPSDEGFRRNVRIDEAFFIGVTEVTNAQYAALVANHEPDDRYSPDDDSPAVGVDWKGAVGFCRRLSRREGVTYRLPTEAEWEYACRAGSPGKYPFDADEFEEYGWSDVTLGRAQRVALLKPNAWGLYDMNGNAAELTESLSPDFYAEPGGTAAAVAVNAPFDQAGPIIRGGPWYARRNACSCTARVHRPLVVLDVPLFSLPPWVKLVSFRVVREKT